MAKKAFVSWQCMNLAKAEYAAQAFTAIGGARLLFSGAPRFNEFVLQTAEEPWRGINAHLLKQKIIGGMHLTRWYPELGTAACGARLNSSPENRSTCCRAAAGGAAPVKALDP